MKILADRYLHSLNRLLPEDAELTMYDPAAGFPGNASRFDALLIRTVTKINPDTLPEAGRLKFIGTATAGFDHVDRAHLNRLGIRFARSAGCNARAVAEYVLTSLLHWCRKNNTDPRTLTAGVVGAGQTGSALIHLLLLFDIPYLAYDPPLAAHDSGFQSCSERELMECDLLSFHTPLTSDGPHPTLHLCSDNWLQNRFRLIINAARGGVVDESALLRSLKSGEVEGAILDVWENEPRFSDTMAKNAFIATPHIAGYSSEAKVRASRMVVEELCRFFDLELNPDAEKVQFDSPEPVIPEDGELSSFLWGNHQIDLYHKDLLELCGLPEEEKGDQFSKLRAETPTRFEYSTILRQSQSLSGIPEKALLLMEP